MSLILALLLAQAGPSVSGGAGPALPQAPLELRRKREQSTGTAPPSSPPTRATRCFAQAKTDPSTALLAAQGWLGEVKGSARVEPGECLGLALTRLERWDEAEAAFIGAQGDAAGNDGALKARYGAMAGHAALAAGASDRALARFAAAQSLAQLAGEKTLAGEIATDRARALVALKRLDEAASVLTQARNSSPASPQAWLLSATLARRQGKLAEAQWQIERAAELLPVDPEIGLEAGVIAVLAGREDAAKLSWQSVLRMAPNSEFAELAQAYLDQLGQPAPPTGR